MGASSDVVQDMQTKFSDLALCIFTRNPPRDPSSRMMPCSKCSARMHDWCTNCPECNYRLPFCVASGRSIFAEDTAGAVGGMEVDSRVVSCRACRHKMYSSEVRKLRNCPLCHSRLEASYH